MTLSPQMISTLVTVVIVVLVLGLRMRRLTRGQRLRLETLWVRPALVLVAAGLLIASTPPRDGVQVAIILAVAAIGALIGWRQAKLMTIGVEPESHQLNLKASPVAIMITYGLLIIRVALRPFLISEASAFHIGVAVVLDSLMALVAGLYIAQSLELFLRARAMLRQAKANVF